MRLDRHHLARAAIVFAAVAVLVPLSACGGGSSSSELPPVEEQLGLEQDGILQREGKAENLIRDCMKAQGFDYVPMDPVAEQARLTGQSGMSEEDFNKQYGYGITTLYDKRVALPPGPNEAIRDALSDTDKQAYDRALYGDDPNATFFDAVDSGDFSHLGGCTKQATEQVFGGLQVFQTLQDKLDQLDEQILADPRMVAAVSKWSACMHQAGYDLAAQDDVDAVLRAKLQAIVGPPDNPNPDYDHAALAALQRDEVSMVTADLSCEKKDITKVEEKVRAEYEATFREQNADLMKQVPPP
jgi:hypothetical protein